MWKALCLALVYLTGMAAVLAYKPSSDRNAAPALAAIAPGPSATDANADELNLTALRVNTWSKADKLSVAFPVDQERVVPVEEIKVAPIVRADEARGEPETKLTRQVSTWHWHAGSKKIERR
jgi:hypothetical protein